MNIKSIFVKDLGYFHALEIVPKDTFGEQYFSKIYTDYGDDGCLCFFCENYSGKIVKQINKNFVIEINFY
jgi:hypothetical protein